MESWRILFFAALIFLPSLLNAGGNAGRSPVTGQPTGTSTGVNEGVHGNQGQGGDTPATLGGGLVKGISDIFRSDGAPDDNKGFFTRAFERMRENKDDPGAKLAIRGQPAREFPGGQTVGDMGRLFETMSKNETLRSQWDAQSSRYIDRGTKIEDQDHTLATGGNLALVNESFADQLIGLDLFMMKNTPEYFGFAPRGTRVGTESLAGLNSRAGELQNASKDAGGEALSSAERDSLAGQFLDLAKNQVSAMVDANSPSAFDLKNDRTTADGKGLDVGKSADLLSLDTGELGAGGLNKSINSLSEIVRNPAFQEKAGALIGPEAQRLAQDAILAASVFQRDTKANIAANGANYVSDLVAFANGGMTPPALTKNANPKAANFSGLNGVLGADGSKLSDQSTEWIELAHLLAKQEHDQPLQKLWSKGITELDKLIADLRRFHALNVLSAVRAPQKPAMWQIYNNALYRIAELLRTVRKSNFPNDSAEAKRAKALFADLNHSSKALLAKISLCKSSQCAEDSMRNFFDSADERELWKSRDLPRYENLRELAALVILARAMSLRDYPAAERATPERFALGYVVKQTFRELRTRQERSAIGNRIFTPPARPSTARNEP